VFISPSINKYFDPITQFKKQYKNNEEFNMIPYSYLFDLKYKNELLHIESILEQKINIQKSMTSGISSMINTMVENGGFSIEGLIYLHF
jgi:abortive infection bacteriophage resistance protein